MIANPYFSSQPWPVPVGCVVAYAGPLAATDTGPGVKLPEIATNLTAQGWLLCDGRSLPCNDYPLLFGVIGMAFGGDGEQQTFCLPDLRGRFVRGVDGGSGHDVDASRRTAPATGGSRGDHVGSLQLDAFQGHEHNYTSTTESPNTAQPGGPAVLMQLADQVTTGEAADGGCGTPRFSAETRPVNLALNYLIRFR